MAPELLAGKEYGPEVTRVRVREYGPEVRRGSGRGVVAPLTAALPAGG
jgi:hypothetical protein